MPERHYNAYGDPIEVDTDLEHRASTKLPAIPEHIDAAQRRMDEILQRNQTNIVAWWPQEDRIEYLAATQAIKDFYAGRNNLRRRIEKRLKSGKEWRT